MNIIVLPLYNDWKSLNKLLLIIEKKLSTSDKTKILIINDCSTQRINIKLKKLKKIKEIEVITNKQNLGSQKSIAVGLSYLNKLNKKFFITIMDSDGEDDPSKIKTMLSAAKNKKQHIIVSCRKKRKEEIFFKLCYKIHLIIFFIFTGKWISFGNFSCFYSKNLKRILSNNNIWYAYSAGILKNNKIIRVHAPKNKRLYDKSKLNYLDLVDHSLRIFTVFRNRFLGVSLVVFILTFICLKQPLAFLTYFIVIVLNFLVLQVAKKHCLKEKVNYLHFVKDIKKFNIKLS